MRATENTPVKDSLKRNLRFGIMLSLTLGMAPFFPEPHILGKVRWIAGGAAGMQPLDYFDLFLHGAPWVFLAYSLVRWLRAKIG